MPRPENAALYKQYQALADATPGVHFVGRLATYRYYNMDQVVAQALTLFAKMSGRRRRDAVAATTAIATRESTTGTAGSLSAAAS